MAIWLSNAERTCRRTKVAVVTGGSAVYDPFFFSLDGIFAHRVPDAGEVCGITIIVFCIAECESDMDNADFLAQARSGRL